jgi:coenzyme F420-reducing hydrogenase alpha subunit
MLDPDRRRKMISLRLSQTEYEVLKTQYRTYGARNVSDLARLALQRVMNGSAASQDNFAAKLAELDNRVHVLESVAQKVSPL